MRVPNFRTIFLFASQPNLFRFTPFCSFRLIHHLSNNSYVTHSYHSSLRASFSETSLYAFIPSQCHSLLQRHYICYFTFARVRHSTSLSQRQSAHLRQRHHLTRSINCHLRHMHHSPSWPPCDSPLLIDLLADSPHPSLRESSPFFPITPAPDSYRPLWNGVVANSSESNNCEIGNDSLEESEIIKSTSEDLVTGFLDATWNSRDLIDPWAKYLKTLQN